jgi:hypothetical protein
MSLDPACHAECLEFIRVAIAEAFRTTAHEIAAVLKEVCTEGHADLSAKSGADLSRSNASNSKHS